MKVKELMTREVGLANPDQSMIEAARQMAELDVGSLPVGADDRLVGMVTDRDIAIRGVAAGRPPETPVREVMSSEVKYCYDDEEVEAVAANMAELQLRRLPVVNRDRRLVGIIALGDIAAREEPEVVGGALSGISERRA